MRFQEGSRALVKWLGNRGRSIDQTLSFDSVPAAQFIKAVMKRQPNNRFAAQNPGADIAWLTIRIRQAQSAQEREPDQARDRHRQVTVLTVHQPIDRKPAQPKSYWLFDSEGNSLAADNRSRRFEWCDRLMPTSEPAMDDSSAFDVVVLEGAKRPR